jgi:hypothetical protein
MAEHDESPDLTEEPMGRGRPPLPVFSDEEQEQFLELIESGFGINMACKEMGVTWHRLDKSRKADPEFTAAIERADEHLGEKHLFLLHGIAERENGHIDALKYLVARRDNAKQFQARMAQERELARSSGGPVAGQVRIKIEYDEPDDRLHRPDDPPAAPAAPGPEDGT